MRFSKKVETPKSGSCGLKEQLVRIDIIVEVGVNVMKTHQ